MSNLTDYGSNIVAERTYTAEAAVSAFYFVVGGAESGAVVLPAGANALNGKGIAQVAAAIGDPVAVAYLGISKFRKSAAVISEGDPLTPAASPLGSLRKAVAGEPVYAIAATDATSTEEYAYCNLIQGGGVLAVPSSLSLEQVITKTALTADAELTTMSVPAGSRIQSITAFNTTANAVSIKIGKTAGATDVVNTVAIGANAIVDLTLLLRVFSLSTAQSLFIASTDWNSANLTLTAVLLDLT